MSRAAIIAVAWLVVGLVAGLVAGCDGGATSAGESSGDDGSAVAIPLVDPWAWAAPQQADDLFASMRPPEVECDPLRGMGVQETAWSTHFEINTGWCNYATVAQTTLEALEPGDTVEVRVWHFELTGGPAQAYLGVGLAGEVRFEQTIPIPSASAQVLGTIEITEPLPAGTPIQFHVHNHGVNSWELIAIERL